MHRIVVVALVRCWSSRAPRSRRQGAEAGGALDWLQFRGPAAGVVPDDPNLPERWSETENVVWTVDIPGLVDPPGRPERLRTLGRRETGDRGRVLDAERDSVFVTSASERSAASSGRCCSLNTAAVVHARFARCLIGPRTVGAHAARRPSAAP